MLTMGRNPEPGSYDGMPPDGRQNMYPESWVGTGNYTDSGCHLQPACLTCPLPECYLDDPNRRGNEQKERDTKIRKSNKNVAEIAVEYNLSKRTIHRIRKGQTS
jgi:hypothetical protein